MDFIDIITNPFLLMSVSIFMGQLIGKFSYKNIKLGSSGVLFAGISISYLVTSYIQKTALDSASIQGEFIPTAIFQLSLIGFIASIGLLTSKNIKSIIKKYGYSFILLAFAITATGALITWISINFIFEDFKLAVVGTYVGALTSSPGLATAMELAKGIGGNAELMVGLGYSIAYIPAVVIVIFFVQLISKQQKNQQIYKGVVEKQTNMKPEESNFCITSFALICTIGILLGKIKIYLGNYLGYFSLGNTGGVIISAIALGHIGKIGMFNFNIKKNQLAVVRDISLNMFLVIVGLNNGYNAINLIRTSGAQLLLIGIITSVISILMGYFIGKKVLKIPTIYLIGGICGSMTSTPGLAASMETLESDETTASYGAAYPFALFFKIIFTSILFNL